MIGQIIHNDLMISQVDELAKCLHLKTKCFLNIRNIKKKPLGETFLPVRISVNLFQVKQYGKYFMFIKYSIQNRIGQIQSEAIVTIGGILRKPSLARYKTNCIFVVEKKN